MPKKSDSIHRLRFSYEGKRYEVSGKTLEEAVEKKVKKLNALKNGEYGISSKMTVKRWCETWLETYKKDAVLEHQYKDYERRIKNIIVPVIGTYKLKDVTDTHLQQIINGRIGFSHSDVKKTHSTIKAIFRQARISRLINWDPSESIVMPKTEKGSHRSITKFEREHILKVCETHRAGLWVKIMLYCGLRPGEAIALDWRDFDFNKKRLNVSRASEAGTNNIKPPKTQAGIRSIPIPDILLGELKEMRRGPFEPVFTIKRFNKRMSLRTMIGLWDDFKKQLDISMGATVEEGQIIRSVLSDDLTPYCFRHTYCTDLQDAGVPINVAKYLMGHSDIGVTSRIYTHTTELVIEEAAEKINKKKSG